MADSGGVEKVEGMEEETEVDSEEVTVVVTVVD